MLPCLGRCWWGLLVGVVVAVVPPAAAPPAAPPAAPQAGPWALQQARALSAGQMDYVEG
eukprot:CAMPEP_0197848366 /NCGR_PEP_ID=MMETSP1438-20131217/8520_1 /TAXON_ID=1461541 /ORGANISM="Pterosperma sp., Strain CCMP1384" /LENGTH=58 /DNA_ID=CAMNT_0043460575 /DNA_START=707 /DNA_END=883 /DNA_ORIENTATION=-